VEVSTIADTKLILISTQQKGYRC